MAPNTPKRPDGGVVTQRTANPDTSAHFLDISQNDAAEAPRDSVGAGRKCETLYIQFANNGAIRKWSREPFDGGEAVNAETCPQSDIAQAARLRSRPCPFCGATPHHGLEKVRNCQLHGKPFQDFSIWCPHGCAKITRSTEERARRDWEGPQT